MSFVTTVLTGGPLVGTVDKVVDKTVGTVAGGAADAVANSGLNAVAAWVLNGTKSALEQVAHLIGTTTAPELTESWFSSTYWRVAGLAALLTVPFIFAAMLQAILRSDLALIGKVVFTYLPVSLLSVSLAAPVVMLLLSATDQMCSVVSSAAITSGSSFLDKAGVVAGGLSTLDGSPFFAVMVGLFAVTAALMLALELMIREAAVYVVVLMLPLAFAAFVWPARRIWAVRLVELLISLILSKFVIVAVLSLAGSALGSSTLGVSQLLTATALLLLASFAPWALMRILPFTELAAGAATALRHELPQAGSRAISHAGSAAAAMEGAGEIAMSLPSRLRRHADQAGQGHVRDDAGSSPAAQTPSTIAGDSASPDSSGSDWEAMPVSASEAQISDPPGGGDSSSHGAAGVAPAGTDAPANDPRSDTVERSERGADFLSHVEDGMVLDLVKGWVWPENPDE